MDGAESSRVTRSSYAVASCRAVMHLSVRGGSRQERSESLQIQTLSDAFVTRRAACRPRHAVRPTSHVPWTTAVTDTYVIRDVAADGGSTAVPRSGGGGRGVRLAEPAHRRHTPADKPGTHRNEQRHGDAGEPLRAVRQHVRRPQDVEIGQALHEQEPPERDGHQPGHDAAAASGRPPTEECDGGGGDGG